MIAELLSPEQVYRVVENRHHNPFDVLGAHSLEENNGRSRWVVRAFLPEIGRAHV